MDTRETIQHYRLVGIALFIGLVFILFVAQAVKMQILQGDVFRARADENRIVIRRFTAPRGIITDRNGKILVRNSPAFRLRTKTADGGTQARMLTHEEAVQLELHPGESEGEIEVDTIREYPEGSTFAHVFGYVSEISPEELSDPAFADYLPGDRIGRLGLEGQYEDVLRGSEGRALLEVDAIGQTLRVLVTDDAVPGKRIQTTLDTMLQRTVSRILTTARQEGDVPSGAVVIVMDASTGALRVMVSVPSFDPNVFVSGDQVERIEGLFSDPEFPLVNRAIAATYPPASTFKVVTGIAGMEEGVIDASSVFEDTGVIRLGPYEFANWYWVQYGKRDGLLDLPRAIARSNDIFFYRVANEVGHEALGEYAMMFGFGARSGIDLPGELPGLVPTEEWKRRVKGEIWLPGNTLHMGIGQGDLLVTPMQIARMTVAIANHGTLVTPHLVSEIIDPQTGERDGVDTPRTFLADIDPETITLIRDGMHQACQEGGTGWPFFDFPVDVGCKTGTAEFGDPLERTHAWFTAFAPFDDPEVVVTVLVEKGGDGSSVAGPIAKKILAEYFEIQLPENSEPDDRGNDETHE